MNHVKLIMAVMIFILIFLGAGTVSAAPTITVSVEPAQVHVGDEVTIHVTIQNPDAVFYSNIQVLIPWPDGLEYKSHHGGGINNIEWDPVSGIWYPGNMRPESRGQQKNLWIVGTVTPELENKTLTITARYLQIYDQGVNVAPLLGTEVAATSDHLTITSVNLVAGFTATPTTGAAPLTVQFTDSSVGKVTSYAWDFNNDGIIDSTSKNPTWTYATPGTYTVRLTASNDTGTNTKTQTNYITVNGKPGTGGGDGGGNGTGVGPFSGSGNNLIDAMKNLTASSDNPLSNLQKGGGGNEKAYEVSKVPTTQDDTLGLYILAALLIIGLIAIGYFYGIEKKRQ